MSPGSRATSTDTLIRRALMYTRTLTIGRVTRVFANGWVEVEPQIQSVRLNRTTQEEEPVDLAPLSRIPIGMYKAGGFVLTLPVAVGDEGIVLFSDRGLSQWKETGRKAPPREHHFHHLSDGVFIPWPTSRGGAIANFDAGGLYAGLEDQSAYMRIGADGAVQFKGRFSFDGPSEFKGAVQMDSTANIDGAVTTGSTVKSAGVHTAPDFVKG